MVLSSCLCYPQSRKGYSVAKKSQLCEATVLIPLVEIVDGSPSGSFVCIILLANVHRK